MSDQRLTKLKDLLDFQISDGNKQIGVIIPESSTCKVRDVILLYISTPNEVIAMPKVNGVGYYSTPVQVVSRHTDYNSARLVCYRAFEYLSKNKTAKQGASFYPVSPPQYSGKDEQIGAYTFTCIINMRGVI